MCLSSIYQIFISYPSAYPCIEMFSNWVFVLNIDINNAAKLILKTPFQVCIVLQISKGACIVDFIMRLLFKYMAHVSSGKGDIQCFLR